MKQHITVEQLVSLDYEIFEKLLNILDCNKYIDVISADLYSWGWQKEGIVLYVLEEICKKITIGKMIEILKSKGVNWFEVGYPEVEGKTKVFVQITKDLGFWSDSLCDSLWEAVKHVLEVEDE